VLAKTWSGPVEIDEAIESEKAGAKTADESRVPYHVGYGEFLGTYKGMSFVLMHEDRVSGEQYPDTVGRDLETAPPSHEDQFYEIVIMGRGHACMSFRDYKKRNIGGFHETFETESEFDSSVENIAIPRPLRTIRMVAEGLPEKDIPASGLHEFEFSQDAIGTGRCQITDTSKVFGSIHLDPMPPRVD
jgi:hypothetical protein